MTKLPDLHSSFTRSVAPEFQIQPDSYSIEFPFSSQTPVERYYGNEILSHEDGAADYSRLNNGAPLLYNHDADRQLGVVEKAWIGSDKRGYVRVKFSSSHFAQEKFQDIKDNILRNVSFGYQVDDMKLMDEGRSADTEDKNYLITKYLPFEVSFVSIGADNSVGWGRSFDKRDDHVDQMVRDLTIASTLTAESADDGDDQKGDKMTLPNETPPQVDVKNVADGAVKAERDRAQTISIMGEKYHVQDLSRELINGGKSLDEARAAILEVIGERQKAVPQKAVEIGMSEKEVKQFSFLRALNALINPLDKKMQEQAKFEREVSDAASTQLGKIPRGFLVPQDVLKSPMQKRFLSAGAPTAGGNLVDTELQADNFIDLLRAKSVLQRAGATVLTGLHGNLAFPRQTGGTVVAWVGEGNAPAPSQPSFDQVPLSPHTAAAYTDFTRRLLLQSSIDIENLVRKDLATSIALAVDSAGLYGTGVTNQPLGLKNTSGINTIALTAVAPTWAELVQLETEVAIDNADVGTLKYITNAVGRGVLKSSPKVSGQPIYMWDAGTVNGYPVEVSNQLLAGDYLFGNWGDLILGFWSSVDLLVDPYSLSTTGSVRVVAMQDVDVAVRHPESFVRANKTL